MNIPYAFDNRLVLRTPRYPLTESTRHIELQTLLHDSAFMEAVYLASPVLYEECVKWRDGHITAKKDIDKITRSLSKYYTRMSSRCTPFGLFSGCAVVHWNQEQPTAVTVSSASINRHTRLDMHYLCALSQQLALLPEIRNQLLYFPNSSVYTIGEELRYVEYTYINGKRIHQISSVSASEYLDRIISGAYNGATIEQLCSWLTDSDIAEEEAMSFIGELISAQLLVSEMEPAITGTEFLHQLISVLERIKQGDESNVAQILQALHAVDELLQQIDSSDGNEIAQYRRIMQLLNGLGVAFDESKLFQTDIVKQVSGEGVNTAVQEQLLSALDAVNRLSAYKGNTNLQSFIRRFYDRYEDREMPLLEVLDTETGIGYVENSGNNIAPLVDDLVVSSKEKEKQHNWGRLENMLSKKLLEALAIGKRAIEIKEDDLGGFTADWTNLSPSFSVMFRMVNEECNEIYLESVGGSSAANLLGRFAHADPAVNRLVCDVTRQEQERDRGVVYAEVIHLPESRTGNILLHPVFRDYEIPFLAKSSLDKEQQIDVQDLYISVRNNRVILRSRRLNKQVIPRLSTAHNYSYNALPVYRFLCDLQLQDKRPGMSFSWGSLQLQHSFLPRVTYKNTILYLASWTILAEEVKHLAALEDKALQQALHAFREQHGLPRNVVLADGDNELLVDLEHLPMVRTWLDAVKNRSSFVLREFINNHRLVTDEHGQSYVNQFVAVMSKQGAAYEYLNAGTQREQQYAAPVQRHFAPGSEWVYFKLYCGIKSADKILLDAVKPLSEALLQEQLIDKWFFIRYNDPDFHIRLRFHITDLEKIGVVMNQVYEQLLPFKTAGYIWKMQMDTYNREIERYGSNSIELAETFFYHDSVAFTGVLDNTWGDAREQIRWVWGLRAVDELLDGCGLSLREKHTLLSHLRDSFGTEFNMDKSLKLQLNDKYRNNRKIIELVMDREKDLQHDMYPLIQVLQERSQCLAPVTAAIVERHKAGVLEVPFYSLLGSYIHMMINRIATTDPRKQEMVMYEFLSRHYQSALAREKATVAAG